MASASAEYLLDDHPRTLFPLDLTRIAIESGAARIHQFLKEEIKPFTKGQPFYPQLHCYAAKHGLHLRRTLKLDPAAELFIYDLVAANRKHFKRDTRKTRRQYGYYFQGGRPASAMTAYREFKRDLAEVEPKHQYNMRVDVATYFNSLYHHDIVDYFSNVGWRHDHTQALSRFLSEINGSRSIDCLPQGLHPCKVLGAAFLHIVDRSSRLRSDVVLRFLDDIHFFSDDEVAIDADLLLVQRILGEKGLSLNSEKTTIGGGSQTNLEAEIEEIKIGLLRARQEWIEVSGEETEEELIEYDTLNDEQTQYLLGLLRDPNLEEADAELVLTLLSEHGEEVLDRMASVWPRYPALSKPIYNFVTREFRDPTSVAGLAQAFLANAPNATEYQLFWLAKLLQAAARRDETFGKQITGICDHRNATPIVKAKVLELADNRFGLAEMREETLKLGQSDWPSWAAAIGSRAQTKASRNKLIKNFGGLSPLNKVIADIAMALDPVAPEKPPVDLPSF